jgi:hypothetical protein
MKILEVVFLNLEFAQLETSMAANRMKKAPYAIFVLRLPNLNHI